MFSDSCASIRDYNRRLAVGCQAELGVSLMAWKAIKALVDLGALVLAGFAITEGLEPFVGLAFAALIISGPELFEIWLVQTDFTESGTDD